LAPLASIEQVLGCPGSICQLAHLQPICFGRAQLELRRYKQTVPALTTCAGWRYQTLTDWPAQAGCARVQQCCVRTRVGRKLFAEQPDERPAPEPSWLKRLSFQGLARKLQQADLLRVALQAGQTVSEIGRAVGFFGRMPLCVLSRWQGVTRRGFKAQGSGRD